MTEPRLPVDGSRGAARHPGGIVLVDKPLGLTSHDVVARTRRLAGTRKVGHAGTLDPAATGLLLLGLDSSTRLLTYLVGLDKEYEAVIRLGAATVTDDAEGEIVSRASAELVGAVDEARIRDAVADLTGEILQVPSSVSAIKVDGRRSYARVRSGEEVDLPARPVTVAEFEVRGLDRGTTDEGHPYLDVDVRVVCSSGTYIRALARDLGAALGVGGHLTALRRTRVGPFRVTDAVPLDEHVRDGALAPVTVATALYPELRLDADGVRDLAHGKRVSVDGAEDGGPIAVTTPEGRLAGIARVERGVLRPLVNFPTAEVLA
ncbi:tRNA pseudouridine55 synthase [Diaminobutyricimonas aerilata]|uniref:tRNA pseudouridine synthase B n=1 Tax=Diaminobutyricimonas aerilata TaxID=1162967 RepID=A0A2M9CLC0_9MICO|nr:tRNA pseudouridine(55) synthase TruB [Diaminobutyricimonas aerilata]PJJ72669.1 tRNA pseudouridine55 synthase [Diaminobutyricimonas aerilata]